ncbi:MAG: hypothetical protein JF599_03380 [Verrucomicrobia bacterium]|jgi:hypothetical protein|nr:hypothetical protein [Verrucomicrobiota bacterium]
MNAMIRSFVCAAAVVFLAAGCHTPERRPVVVYPVTYDIPVGNTQVSASAGAQNLNVSATQQVTARVGEPLYYQIISPVPVTVSIYERRADMPEPRMLVRELQGTNFTSSLTPSERLLEFVFSVKDSNSNGTLKFTISDRPIAPVMTP